MKIKIIKDDIVNAKPGSSCNCVLSRAIARTGMGTTEDVWVQPWHSAPYAKFTDANKLVQHILLSPEAAKLARDFDDGRHIDPCEIELGTVDAS